MRAPPDLAALHALHGAFFDIFTVMRVQQCAPGARAGGHAMATVPLIFCGPEGRTENRRRRRDADRRIIFLQWQQACRSMPAALYRAAVLRFDAPLRRRAAAPTGRCSAEAHTPLRHEVPPPAGVPGTLVCSLLRDMHVERSSRRHAVHAGQVGWRGVCSAWSCASGASRIALACLLRGAWESGQALVPTG